MRSGFIAVIKRLSNGKGIKAAKDASIALPLFRSSTNFSTYFSVWSKGKTSFLNYGATAGAIHSRSFVESKSSYLQGKHTYSTEVIKHKHADAEVPLYGGQAADSASQAIDTSPNGQINNAKLPKKKITINNLTKRKGANVQDPITMLTAYDYSSAILADKAGVDMILVGDSLGMVMQGNNTTCAVTMEEMIYHCKAVMRGTQTAFVVADMPFGSYTNETDAVNNAVRLIKEGGADAVKLEGGVRVARFVRAIVDAGISVVGHIGLTPQSCASLGGFVVQGKTADNAISLFNDAKALEDAGAFSVVLEMIPHQIAHRISDGLSIPTIGIGAGNKTSGQVLVYHDVLGLYDKFKPKFCKQYVSLAPIVSDALERYVMDVKTKQFPKVPANSFSASKRVVEMFDKAVQVELNTQEPLMLPKKFESLQLHYPKINVIFLGGGAMASLFAAKLSNSAAVETHMLTTWKSHSNAIAESGIRLIDQNMREFVSGDCVVHNDMESLLRSINSSLPTIILPLVKGHETTNQAALQAKDIISFLENNGQSDSVVLSLQNGMGNMEILTTHLLEDKVAAGVTYEAAKIEQPGQVIHAGSGVTTIVSNKDCQLPLLHSLGFLLDQAGHSTEVVWEGDSSAEEILFSKLYVNAIINPLTAILKVKNGELQNTALPSTIRGALAEIHAIGLAMGIKSLPSIEQMHSKVMEVASKTANNTSSMLADVQRGAQTEIDNINGFVERKGKEYGIHTPFNSMLRELVRCSSNQLATKQFNICEVVSTVSEMQQICSKAKGKKSIGFVPTMGALHEGHLQLVRKAVRENDIVVVSIFVNPTQFGEANDFERYPNVLEEDVALLKKEGVSFVFNPTATDVYCNNTSQNTLINFANHNDWHEGKARPTFFQGVGTVCTKLFNIVQPDAVYFGQKDGSQCLAISQLIKELNFDIKMNIVDTIREADGLAMSSRNRYLNEQERQAAPTIFKALKQMKECNRNGERNLASLTNCLLSTLQNEKLLKEIEKPSFYNLATNTEISTIPSYTLSDEDRNNIIVSVAANLGNTRLIDNIIL